ncbi:MAG: amidohydrolase [Bacteroidetes bacterium]|jgi:predicted amidohydrolase YtcJ|nr:amidohydrolase [Bacteroidota bacterium]MBS1980838.1 amidohydrolase [Bacteroidota bacterium]
MKNLILLFFVFSCSNVFSQADLIFYNGRVWTGENEKSFAEAVAIKGNKIWSVGTSTEIIKLGNDNTEKIDLNGKLLMAGFNDAHIHFLSGSLLLSEVMAFDAKSLQQVQQLVVDYAARNPSRPWITGRGWLYDLPGFGGSMPTKQMLDVVEPDRPVFLKAYDGHTAWANSKALMLAGIDKNFTYNGYGEVLRDASGEPTGILTENAMDLIARVVPKPTQHEKLSAMRMGFNLISSLGITSLQNASGSPEEVALYEELLRNNDLTSRVSAAFSITAQTSEADIVNYSKIKKAVGKNPMLSAGAVKFVSDGVIESHTAAMLEPYSNTPATLGNLSIPQEVYEKLVIRFDKEGFQIYTHAIGDRAVRTALDAYEKAKKVNRTTDRRHRVEHIETINPADLPRFAQLGVMASMEPIHADPGTIEVWEKAIGEKRLPNSFAWAALLKAGAHLVYSSDWPAAISLDPIRGIHVAVNRSTPEGKPVGGWIPEQKISMVEALKAYTQGGAYSSFEEKTKGKVLPGYLADVIVLSENLFTLNPMDVYKTKVVQTVMDGKVVYRAK